MNRKLILLSLISGLLTIGTLIGLVFSVAISYQFGIMYLLFFPGLIFAFVLIIFYNDVTTINKVCFLLMSFVIYLFSIITTYSLFGITHGLSIVCISTISLLLFTLSFNKFIRQLETLKKSLTIATIGGLIAGGIIFILITLVHTFMHGPIVADLTNLFILLIIPLWQTAFGLIVK